MVVYTKKGDKGETGLFSSDPGKSRRVSKNSPVIAAIGAIDEANSFLGICVALSKSKIKKELEGIQRDMFTIGSILAGANLKLPSSRVKYFEHEIDKMDANLPVLANFILPGGGEQGAYLHYARTLIRRAERALVSLPKIQTTNPEILVYINRLSDYLFMLARDSNHKEGREEKVWIKKRSK